MDISLGVAIAAAALSSFFALASYCLREHRRVQFEGTFGHRPSSRRTLALLTKHMTAMRLTASLSRALANTVLVVAIIWVLGWQKSLAGAAQAVVTAGAIIAIFGVAIPHGWADHDQQKVLAIVFWPVLICRYILYPVIAIMQAFDLPIRRLVGDTSAERTNSDRAKQEILQVASEGLAEGEVANEEVEMIESVIEFGQTQAAEIMTPRTDVFALPGDMSWPEACQKVTQAGHTRVPVFETNLDNIIGILYAKDLLGYTTDEKPSNLRQIMRKTYFIPESKLLNELLKEFKSRKVHLAVVLDEYGGTAGLVTIEDVLEEIVGDISDEYDAATTPLLRRIDEKTAEVEGRMYIDDLNDAMGLNVPEDAGYETVAGMVFSELGFIPSVGEKLHSHNARFTVLSADERKINRLRVELLGQPESEAT